MHAKLIQNTEHFTQLKQTWQALYNRSNTQSIFLTWDWMHTWWQTYHTRLAQARPHLIAFYEADTLVALLPMVSYRSGGLRILTFMGAVFESSDYLDCIAPENISDASLLAAWEALSPRQSDAGADLVILANTLPDARINRLAPSLFPNRRYDKRRTSVCPYLPLPDNEESLFKQLSKNMKSTLRRTRNKINKDPRFTIDRVEDPDELDESVQNLFTLHNMRFTDKGQATKFNYEQRGAFHKRIAAVWLKQDRLRFYRVLYDDSAIGYLYCYYHNNTILYMQAGFHPDYGKYGLGNQLMLRAMNEGMENGAVEFDFMRGNESYKYKWTSLFRELFTTRIALTSRGARLLLKDALLTHIKQFIRQFIPKK